MKVKLQRIWMHPAPADFYWKKKMHLVTWWGVQLQPCRGCRRLLVRAMAQQQLAAAAVQTMHDGVRLNNVCSFFQI